MFICHFSPTELLKFSEKDYLKVAEKSLLACNYDLDDVDMQWLNSTSTMRTLKKGNVFYLQWKK